jgi:hypothetical protein
MQDLTRRGVLAILAHGAPPNLNTCERAKLASNDPSLNREHLQLTLLAGLGTTSLRACKDPSTRGGRN